MSQLDRRSFLCAAGAAPWLLGARGPSPFLRARGERVLLVLELVGGNDGLNTVIPIDDPRYPALRPKLQVVRKGAHALGDGTAFHPALARLHRRVQGGQGAVLHGVGYPAPDRSHFRSRDIWHVADPTHVRVQADTTGWLGRAADLLAGGSSGVSAASLGGLELPLLLRSRRAMVPSLRRVEDFQWLSAAGGGAVPAGAAQRATLGEGVPPPASLDARSHAAATAHAAVRLADDLGAALERYRPRAEYPDSALGRDLQLAARLCAAGFGARLLHVAFAGFDTHARQLPTHASLLGQLDAALDALLEDLAGHGLLQEVVVFVHSEFGRRAAENASQGTDHGAAAPVFVFGGAVAGGTHGTVPDLERLDDGDVRSTCDFRAVYADLLQWLGIDVPTVLGGGFAATGLLSTSRR